jgi:putative transposase
MKVSRSGYFKWLITDEPRRLVEDNKLKFLIVEIFKESKQSYGTRRIRNEIVKMDMLCSRRRISRLMKLAGISPAIKRKFVVTTDSKHNLQVHSNLLERNFRVDIPNKVWVSDITYIPTNEGWLYLSTVLDLYSKRAIGWSMSDNLKAELAVNALDMAVKSRNPQIGLVHHSDRGVQYACGEYQDKLNANGIICSMSRKGDCWDNAVAESFFATLKKECIHKNKFKSRQEARMEIFYYIETFYNRRRTHSKLNYKSPMEFEEMNKQLFADAA